MELYITLAVFAFLTLICLLSSKLSSHINMPCLLLFLAVGMLAGSEGIGGIGFDNAAAANSLGSIALAFILFSGGFDTEWKSVKPVFRTGGLLSSLGVLLTALLTGLFAWWICKLLAPTNEIPLSWCFLLGSIISSTDAAAVFSILRSRSVSLRGKLRPLLELESGSNDPMAAFLTVFMTGVITSETAAGGAPMPPFEYLMILPMFAIKMSIGLCSGWLIGRGAVWLYNRINFEYNGLYYVLGVVAVLTSFSVTELIYGNGFMAVYTAGMVMGNRRFVFHNGVGKFYDGIAWMMQVVLFSMLGLLAFPSQVWSAKWLGLAIAVFLMVIARPLATFICMWRSGFSLREQTLVSWIGLRGGAPIMLATFPLMAGVSQSALMFHIVFFIVITSVLLQGMTIMPMARLLGLDAPLRKTPRIPLSIEETGDKSTISRELIASEGIDHRSLAEIKLPEGALILLIRRDEKIIIPRGDTRLAEGDVLTVMGSPEAVHECATKFSILPDEA
ncbi:MAG: potassium/proton antiporter [Victivallaceae bacterium]|nr:potassium/proton antiporter [Victivallaceae bacterium]